MENLSNPERMTRFELEYRGMKDRFKELAKLPPEDQAARSQVWLEIKAHVAEIEELYPSVSKP